jgi:hypothetical protein
MPFWRLPFIPFWAYVSISFLVTVYVLVIGNFGPQHYELAALPILLLALPWSFIFHDFKPRLLASDYNNSVLIMVMFIAINVAILFVCGLAVDAIRKKRRAPVSSGPGPS